MVLYNRDPISSINDGDRLVGELIARLPTDEQQDYRARLSAIPRIFWNSAEQTQILDNFRSLRTELTELLGKNKAGGA